MTVLVWRTHTAQHLLNKDQRMGAPGDRCLEYDSDCQGGAGEAACCVIVALPDRYLSPGSESIHASTSPRLYRTAEPSFTNFGPLRKSRHRRRVPTLMLRYSATCTSFNISGRLGREGGRALAGLTVGGLLTGGFTATLSTG